MFTIIEAKQLYFDFLACLHGTVKAAKEGELCFVINQLRMLALVSSRHNHEETSPTEIDDFLKAVKVACFDFRVKYPGTAEIPVSL